MEIVLVVSLKYLFSFINIASVVRQEYFVLLKYFIYIYLFEERTQLLTIFDVAISQKNILIISHVICGSKINDDHTDNTTVEMTFNKMFDVSLQYVRYWSEWYFISVHHLMTSSTAWLLLCVRWLTYPTILYGIRSKA